MNLFKWFMRVGMLALLVTSIQLLNASPARSQTVDEVKVRMELKHESLADAFQKIESQTHFHFMYHDREVRDVRDLNMESSELSVEAVLTRLLSNTSLTYRQVANQILVATKPTIAI